ncbi:MAG: DEAD-box ATP-dependent RNA helicase CshA (EC [uncultured Sulfurovum sp.]|uniref:DEAD-box ATP-dependent RNA helicase CshA (EC) n=1 Tax=uncultured Sulfurovum sp. TaxID=269237 RepID=A0A6S6RU46_9BACT|nr:MAG: DEAD-box ATP-dependent RNA helicase CshA (EC [uncultured Sulfurovum sp.]
MTFKEFNFKDTLNQAIDDIGFKEPSPVQADVIPHILAGKDLIAQVHIGTGKTAAFGLPVIQQMVGGKGIEALILAPTIELAVQVSDELFHFGEPAGLTTTTVYGGTPYDEQVERINQANIIVATPGRLQDLLQSKQITINPAFVILDDADQMLEMGLEEQIKNIFKFLPAERQTLIFSATMPEEVKTLGEEVLNNPVSVDCSQRENI